MDTPKRDFPWIFILLAYGLAWIFWVPVALTGTDYQSSPLLMLLVLAGVFGPGLAGIILNRRENDKQARRDFWRRMFDLRRIRPLWFLIIIALWPLMQLLAVGAASLLGGELPQYEFVKENTAQPVNILVVLILYFLQAGLEELGWRGYLLERLQKTMSLTRSSLIIGIFHAFWHLPLFWVVGTNQIKMGFGLDFILFVILVLTTSVYSTWCYIDNGRSTLAATLLHTTGNLNIDIFNIAPDSIKQRIYVILMALGAILVMLNWSRQKADQKTAETSL